MCAERCPHGSGGSSPARGCLPHDLDIQVSKLKLLKANHLSQRYALEDRLLKLLPQQIKSTEERIAGYEQDVAMYMRQDAERIDGEEVAFAGMMIKEYTYKERTSAGVALLEACKGMTSPDPQEIGHYQGFSLWLSFDSFNKEYKATLRGALGHHISLGADASGNLTRLNNALVALPEKLAYCRDQLTTLHKQMETAKAEIAAPFKQESELQEKTARLTELNVLLNMDKRENEMIEAGGSDEEPELLERRRMNRQER